MSQIDIYQASCLGLRREHARRKTSLQIDVFPFWSWSLLRGKTGYCVNFRRKSNDRCRPA
jgi:hypothetical protein